MLQAPGGERSRQRAPCPQRAFGWHGGSRGCVERYASRSGCDTTSLDLTAAELRRCETARCSLAGLRAAASLAGTRISADDLLACALELAAAPGIVVAGD